MIFEDVEKLLWRTEEKEKEEALLMTGRRENYCSQGLIILNLRKQCLCSCESPLLALIDPSNVKCKRVASSAVDLQR